jgi:alkanesulfonate monooxygenase SsuD/methylene tetrahydromethanopterin reductase-like flavin-dependent oxidoreductase (luciferase family)
MNAGASATGQAFAIRKLRRAVFDDIARHSFEETAGHVSSVRALAQQAGRHIDVYTVGVVTCRPTAQEVGDPDSVARDMTRLAALGLKGIAVSFVNYLGGRDAAGHLRPLGPQAYPQGRTSRRPAHAFSTVADPRYGA